MARNHVSKIPDEILAELRQRLFDSDFSDYTQHAEWLCSRGYQISRSALHRYGKLNKGSITAAVKCSGDSVQSLRLECLAIAALIPQADGAAGLIATADELISWVLTG